MGVNGATLKRGVLHACYEALEEVGFFRYRKENVDLPIVSGINCWVGLNTDLKSDIVQINPFVGIHAVEIERCWTSLKKGKYPGKYSRSQATYAVPMGILSPAEPAFLFDLQTDIKSESVRLANLYTTVGLEYARSISDYDALLPLLQDRAPMLGGNPERVAVCLMLLNRISEAESFVLTYLKNKPDYFSGFADPFLEYLRNSKLKI